MTSESSFSGGAGSEEMWAEHASNAGSREGSETSSAAPPAVAEHAPPFDLEELLGRCLGNVDIARRVMDRFETGFDEQMGKMRRYVDAGDAAGVAQVAHRLKGSAANIAAPVLTHIAKTIEVMARSEKLADIPAQLQALREEWKRFQDFRSACAEAMTLSQQQDE